MPTLAVSMLKTREKRHVLTLVVEQGARFQAFAQQNQIGPPIQRGQPGIGGISLSGMEEIDKQHKSGTTHIAVFMHVGQIATQPR